MRERQQMASRPFTPVAVELKVGEDQEEMTSPAFAPKSSSVYPVTVALLLPQSSHNSSSVHNSSAMPRKAEESSAAHLPPPLLPVVLLLLRLFHLPLFTLASSEPTAPIRTDQFHIRCFNEPYLFPIVGLMHFGRRGKRAPGCSDGSIEEHSR
uniref:Uncharacterized protein n=1 Tax=Knipowitschia caucasica TaxID=637954 RepID=A0AAV2JKP6_KNICA